MSHKLEAAAKDLTATLPDFQKSVQSIRPFILARFQIADYTFCGPAQLTPKPSHNKIPFIGVGPTMA